MSETLPPPGSTGQYTSGGGQPPPKDPCDDPTPPTTPKPCPPPPATPCPEPPPCPDPPVKPCPPKTPDPCADPPAGDQPPTDPGPVKPDDPAKPGDGYTKPNDPSKPNDGYTKPGDPSKPNDGYTKPNDPSKPNDGYTKPGDPSKPNDGYTKPEDPAKPGGGYTKPEDPAKPGGGYKKPDDPAKPTPGGCADGGAKGTEQQLKAFEDQLKAAQQSVQELESAKAKATALDQQVQALKDTIKAQKTANDAYQVFYNATQLQARTAAQYIQTVRCQLKIPNKKCVDDVIAEGWARVKTARDARDAQLKKVAAAEQVYARTAFELEYAKGLYEFFKSGLQDQVKKQAAELTKLQGLADPKKDQCEAEFYLTEMEWFLRSEHCRPDTSPECYRPELRLGTFLDCWGPGCYCTAYDRAIVDYNAAVLAEKEKKTLLDREKTTLKDLEDALKKVDAGRRDWVLSELKARGCCKPKDNPAAAV